MTSKNTIDFENLNRYFLHISCIRQTHTYLGFHAWILPQSKAHYIPAKRNKSGKRFFGSACTHHALCQNWILLLLLLPNLINLKPPPSHNAFHGLQPWGLPNTSDLPQIPISHTSFVESELFSVLNQITMYLLTHPIKNFPIQLL